MEPPSPPPPPSARGAFTARALFYGTLRAWGRNALSFTVVALLAWSPMVALMLRIDEEKTPLPPQLAFFFLWLMGLATSGALSWGILQDLRGEKRPRLHSLLAMIGTRLWPVFTVSALYTATIVAGFFLFILPGVLAFLAGYVALPALLAHPKLGAVGALQRSWQLTQGHRLTLLATVLLLGTASSLVAWVSFLYIDAAQWIPPIPGTIALSAILATLDGLTRCCAAVAYRQLEGIVPVERNPAPTLL